MRKSIISFIIGVALTIGVSTYADSLVGKTIESQIPVKVSGEQLPTPGVVVEGTTYVPLRAIGNALDMNVSYDKETGAELTEKAGETVEQTIDTQEPNVPQEPQNNPPAQMSDEDAESIRVSEEQITLARKRIEENKLKITELDVKIAETNKIIESLPDGDDKKYQLESIKHLNNQKKTAEEMIDMSSESIDSMQAYINKLKSKYETP